MRVFIGPLEVAGIGSHLVDGLQQLGVYASLVCDRRHRFEYRNEVESNGRLRLWRRAAEWRARLQPSAYVRKALAKLLHGALSWLVLLWAIRRFDAFVFLFGRTITDSRLELPFLRLLGRRTIIILVGSDARPAYMDGHQMPADEAFSPRRASRLADRQRRRLQRLERQAHAVVNARATAQFMTRPFVNWFAIGIPRPAHACPPRPIGPMVRVLHSPSHAVLKGTAEIKAAVRRLQARGVPVELVTIENRPNVEVLQALCDCDLVVDQLYSDTPMAAFATEAASLGRPVLVCGYAADDAAAQVWPFPLPPTAYVRPEDFESTLEALVRSPAHRAALARDGSAFVVEHCSPRAVAARLLRIVRDDVPPQWWCDPQEVDYVGGCGVPDKLLRQRLRAMIDDGGLQCLHVSDKPRLERALATFADGAAA
jgi:hypothetical protein